MPPRQLTRSKAMDMRRHEVQYVSPLLLPFTDREAFAHYKKTGETWGASLDLDTRATAAVRKHKKAMREKAMRENPPSVWREKAKRELAMRELSNRGQGLGRPISGRRGAYYMHLDTGHGLQSHPIT